MKSRKNKRMKYFSLPTQLVFLGLSYLSSLSAMHVLSLPTRMLPLDSIKITWSHEATTYDKKIVDDFFYHQGIHISGPFMYDGIFVQAKYDPTIIFREGAGVNNKFRGKELHVLQNSSWRSVPDIILSDFKRTKL